MESSEELHKEAYKFLQISPDGIWCFRVDPALDTSWEMEKQVEWILENSQIIDANETFARMYGFTDVSSVMGMPLKSILPTDKPEEWEHIREFIRGGYSSKDQESLVYDKNGNVKYFLNSVHGVLIGGKLSKIWGIQKDITDLKKSHFEFQRLYDIEHILGQLSKKIISINPSNYSEMVQECLELLGEFTKVDRVYVFRKFGKLLDNTLEWCAPGIEPAIQQNQSLPIDSVASKVIDVLREKNLYLGYEEDNFGLESASEIEHIQSQGIKSLLIVGLRKNGDLVGFVGYDSVEICKRWNREDIELLKIFSDMLSIVTENVDYQKELKRKEESLSEFYDRINEDLEIAKITQKNIVSLEFPESPVFNITSFFKPYEKVGGDIISYFENDDRLNILFGDVSGHGISSAMVSGMVVLSFKNSARMKDMPHVVLNHLNRDLKEVVLNHHISAVATCFCTRERKMRYSYAGHPPLALIRAGKVLELDGMNTPLLTIDNIEYFESELILEPGDRVIYYSDGCYEVFNHDKEFMGLYPFLEIMGKYSSVKNPREFIQKVMGRVVEYSSDDIRDDLTMLIVDVK